MEDGAEDMTVTNVHIYSSQDSPDETLGNLFTWCSRNCHSHRSVQFSRSVVSDSLGPHGLQHARLPQSITNSRSLLRLMSIKSVTPSNHLTLCHCLLLLPSIFPNIRVFSSELALHIRWLKYWSFSFSIYPSSEYLELTSFRIDWFGLLAVQGTLKSLLRHHSFKSSILQHSVSFYYPALTSIHDYWKNHSFDQMDPCRQSNVSAF